MRERRHMVSLLVLHEHVQRQRCVKRACHGGGAGWNLRRRRRDGGWFRVGSKSGWPVVPSQWAVSGGMGRGWGLSWSSPRTANVTAHLPELESMRFFARTRSRPTHTLRALTKKNAIGQESREGKSSGRPASPHDCATKINLRTSALWNVPSHGVACMSMLCYPSSRLVNCLRQRKG
jgi:hypothetical protein